jgi:hypothetical protein
LDSICETEYSRWLDSQRARRERVKEEHERLRALDPTCETEYSLWLDSHRAKAQGMKEEHERLRVLDPLCTCVQTRRYQPVVTLA